MIRYERWLTKRTPQFMLRKQVADFGRLSLVNDCLFREIELLDEEAEAKDTEIGDLKMKIKDLSEEVESREADIQMLLEEADKSSESYEIGYRFLGEQLDNLRCAAKARDAKITELQRSLDEARAVPGKLKRLHSNEGIYDAATVNEFREETTAKLAALAQQVLDNGDKISFAAACAVVLKRQLDAANFASRTLVEMNGKLTNKLNESPEAGRASQTRAEPGCGTVQLQ